MLRRHFITGEWEEVNDAGLREKLAYANNGEVRTVEREKSSRSAISSKNPWVSTSLAVHPHEVEAYNRAAQQERTGAYYRPDGALVCTTNASRNREMARRGYGDSDAGYGQRPPGG